ncbi:zinc ABC transporter substrate-binding protein [Crocosphaera sp. UHCC 0190]|uniref:metal ABC transporter solute-binding protein, Zn/Mn family n=1 Tax=Crocosphaera sp. UHCC 0190 TaxID=3110246 RepID=UPI002B1F1239|nr:zinc ABC transporter substrate-binding protein [Crocosphaera sp. UHCC 0190]MEA5509325.1 zinc ABC transporter substrate-binding protein [Crocosphaera sp. UHCC 0190]
MKKLPSLVLSFLLGVNLITGCSSPDNPTSQTPPKETTATVPNEEILNITVSVVPQEYFVKKIGGDHVKINVMVEPGTEPDNYEPKPQQLQALSKAKAYIGIGIPFERILLDKVTQTNPKLLIVDSTKGIEKLSMIPHDHHDNHGHEKSEDEPEMTLDPHVWLSPRLVKIQAQHIYETLVKLDPKNQTEYETNLNHFLQEIDQLDAKIKENLVNVKQRKFIVFHPAWGYFAQEYNLTQVPIEVGGQEPSAAELGKLIKEAKKENIKIVFAQPELSSQSAKVIAKEIGGEVLLISPVAPDWSNNLLEVSKTFAKALN